MLLILYGKFPSSKQLPFPLQFMKIYEEYEGMSINPAPVAQKVDSAIQWIKGVRLVSLILIHWIVIYQVNRAIQLLNNWGEIFLI